MARLNSTNRALWRIEDATHALEQAQDFVGLARSSSGSLPTRQNEGPIQRHGSSPPMEPASFNLGTVLLATSGLFCLATLYFGTRGGYYDTDDYDGNGTAH